MPIGDDVVDLSAPGARDKSRQDRFMARVFTPGERELIARSRGPDRTLWMLWAAKEAAFKAAQKLKPDLAFAHRGFAVELAEGGQGGDGWVLACGLRLRVAWELRADWVHAFAATPDCWAATAEIGLAVEEISAAEPSAQSLAARRLARVLLGRWSLGDVEVSRAPRAGGLGPPVLRRGAAPLSGYDVSLSHDGRYVSAAVCRLSG